MHDSLCTENTDARGKTIRSTVLLNPFPVAEKDDKDCRAGQLLSSALFIMDLTDRTEFATAGLRAATEPQARKRARTIKPSTRMLNSLFGPVDK